MSENVSDVVSKLYTSATSTGKKWQDDSLLWYFCVPLFSKIDTQKMYGINWYFNTYNGLFWRQWAPELTIL